jgi:hypothetical protein
VVRLQRHGLSDRRHSEEETLSARREPVPLSVAVARLISV